MTDYLKGNTPATIYKQLVGVGAAADHAGLTASLKSVWTDDGAGGATASSIKISSAAIRVESNNQLRFRDDAIYIYSSGDTILNLVADGEIDLATAAVDINATSTLALDNTNTSNGVVINTATSGSPVSIGHTTSETTVNDNLTVTGTTAHTGVVTMATGVKLQFVDGNEYLSGNSSDLTIGASGDINLTASSDVNIPANIGLTFGDDGEKIEGDGTNLAVASSGALNITGAAASTWKTTAGSINIDSEASTVEIDGHSGVTIQGNSAEIDIVTLGAVDIDSAGFTLDGSTVSIDGTDDSNVTVTGSGKDLTLAVAGGGTQKLALSSAGTAADALTITSTAGGIDIFASGAAAGEDIDIYAIGSSVKITSTETIADAVDIKATTGGIDITSGVPGSVAGLDIDITAVAASINLAASENAANAIYLHADGGTGETIKIYVDQGTGDDSIYLLSDLGGISIESGKTGAITNMASDSTSSITNAVIRIGTDTANCDIAIGNATSDVLIGDNLKVAGDLHVTGSMPAGDTITAGTIARLTMTNTDEQNAVGGRDSEILFKGESATGTAHELSAITVMQQTEDQYYSKMIFRLNDSTSGASLAAVGGADDVLTLTYDKTATFGGAIAAGTNVITGGQLNVDNIRLDGNTMTSTDSNGDITLTPNGTGGVALIGATASGDYAVVGGSGSVAAGNYGVGFGRAVRASGVDSVALGDNCVASGANAVAIGDTSTSSGKSTIALGTSAKADRQFELSFAAGAFASAGDTRGVHIHTFDSLTMSASWQSIDSGTGGITFDSDTVACGTVHIVGSTTGAAKTIGYIIEFICENDGGTYAIVGTPVVRTHETEDTDLNAQVAIDSNTLVAQVIDSGANAGTMRWSAFWTIVQHTF
jgi:hypothetical protein